MEVTTPTENHTERKSKKTTVIKTDNEKLFISKRIKVSFRIIGITTDNSRNIYVTSGNAGVWMLNDRFPPRLLASRGNAEGIVWNHIDNSLYVCESSEHRLSQFSLDTGNHCCFAGSGRPGNQDGLLKDARFCCPTQIAVDMNGNIYVGDQSGVKKIHFKSKVVQNLFQSDDAPTGLAVSKDGQTIFACDASGIHKFDDRGYSKISSSSYDNSQDSMCCPYGIVLDDKEQNLFICDSDPDTDFDYSVQSTVLRKMEVRTGKISNYCGKKFHKCITRNLDGTIYTTSQSRRSVIGLQDMWKVERFVWIGNLKEDAKDCCLARLPKEIIKIIALECRKL